jgi:DNA helicase-2/ATP-dependent DNA helicase PcrA
VGDDAQSIYSFRGATIQNILQFQKDYDDVKVIKLEQNYRSSQNIINVANEVIKHNKGQIPKNLWTDNQEGEKIRLVRTMTDNEEGKYVADTIQEQRLRNHYRNNDFAILYRTNAQSRAFEESLRRMNIPYTIYGGISFYQRKEIKDFVGYLRLLVNSRDEESLKRIINYPTRGIGKTSVDRAILAANDNNISMWEVLENAAQFGYKGGTLEAIDNFVLMIRSFASMLKDKNAYEVAIHVGKQTNFVRELFNDKSTEGVARYENVQELLNSIKEFTETPANEEGEVGDKGLGAYLQQITLLTDADEKDVNADTVKLMTIHAAKGLEFGCVFACGLEEMLFPSGLSINTREELEEERRLFYVVITRAKKQLWITYANTRYKFGSLVQNEPSRFINELPEQYLDRSFSGGGARNQQGSFFGGSSAYDRMHRGFDSAAQAERRYGAPNKPATPSYITPKPSVKTVEHIPSPDFVPSDTTSLEAGQRVEHQKFGFGEVIKLEGSAHNPIATVKFDLNGEKKIMLNYAKLRILK